MKWVICALVLIPQIILVKATLKKVVGFKDVCTAAGASPQMILETQKLVMVPSIEIDAQQEREKENVRLKQLPGLDFQNFQSKSNNVLLKQRTYENQKRRKAQKLYNSQDYFHHQHHKQLLKTQHQTAASREKPQDESELLNSHKSKRNQLLSRKSSHVPSPTDESGNDSNHQGNYRIKRSLLTPVRYGDSFGKDGLISDQDVTSTTTTTEIYDENSEKVVVAYESSSETNAFETANTEIYFASDTDTSKIVTTEAEMTETSILKDTSTGNSVYEAESRTSSPTTEFANIYEHLFTDSTLVTEMSVSENKMTEREALKIMLSTSTKFPISKDTSNTQSSDSFYQTDTILVSQNTEFTTKESFLSGSYSASALTTEFPSSDTSFPSFKYSTLIADNTPDKLQLSTETSEISTMPSSYKISASPTELSKDSYESLIGDSTSSTETSNALSSTPPKMSALDNFYSSTNSKTEESEEYSTNLDKEFVTLSLGTDPSEVSGVTLSSLVTVNQLSGNTNSGSQRSELENTFSTTFKTFPSDIITDNSLVTEMSYESLSTDDETNTNASSVIEVLDLTFSTTENLKNAYTTQTENLDADFSKKLNTFSSTREVITENSFLQTDAFSTIILSTVETKETDVQAITNTDSFWTTEYFTHENANTDKSKLSTSSNSNLSPETLYSEVSTSQNAELTYATPEEIAVSQFQTSFSEVPISKFTDQSSVTEVSEYETMYSEKQIPSSTEGLKSESVFISTETSQFTNSLSEFLNTKTSYIEEKNSRITDSYSVTEKFMQAVSTDAGQMTDAIYFTESLTENEYADDISTTHENPSFVTDTMIPQSDINNENITEKATFSLSQITTENSLLDSGNKITSTVISDNRFTEESVATQFSRSENTFSEFSTIEISTSENQFSETYPEKFTDSPFQTKNTISDEENIVSSTNPIQFYTEFSTEPTLNAFSKSTHELETMQYEYASDSNTAKEFISTTNSVTEAYASKATQFTENTFPETFIEEFTNSPTVDEMSTSQDNVFLSTIATDFAKTQNAFSYTSTQESKSSDSATNQYAFSGTSDSNEKTTNSFEDAYTSEVTQFIENASSERNPLTTEILTSENQFSETSTPKLTNSPTIDGLFISTEFANTLNTFSNTNTQASSISDAVTHQYDIFSLVYDSNNESTTNSFGDTSEFTQFTENATWETNPLTTEISTSENQFSETSSSTNTQASATSDAFTYQHDFSSGASDSTVTAIKSTPNTFSETNSPTVSNTEESSAMSYTYTSTFPFSSSENFISSEVTFLMTKKIHQSTTDISAYENTITNSEGSANTNFPYSTAEVEISEVTSLSPTSTTRTNDFITDNYVSTTDNYFSSDQTLVNAVTELEYQTSTSKQELISSQIPFSEVESSTRQSTESQFSSTTSLTEIFPSSISSVFESQTADSSTLMTTLIIDDSAMQNDITVGTENSVISTTNTDTFTTNYPSSEVSFTTNTLKPEISESTTSMQSEEIKTITTDSHFFASTEINAATTTSEFGSTFTTDMEKTEGGTMNDLLETTVSSILSTTDIKPTTPDIYASSESTFSDIQTFTIANDISDNPTPSTTMQFETSSLETDFFTSTENPLASTIFTVETPNVDYSDSTIISTPLSSEHEELSMSTIEFQSETIYTEKISNTVSTAITTDSLTTSNSINAESTNTETDEMFSFTKASQSNTNDSLSEIDFTNSTTQFTESSDTEISAFTEGSLVTKSSTSEDLYLTTTASPSEKFYSTMTTNNDAITPNSLSQTTDTLATDFNSESTSNTKILVTDTTIESSTSAESLLTNGASTTMDLSSPTSQTETNEFITNSYFNSILNTQTFSTDSNTVAASSSSSPEPLLTTEASEIEDSSLLTTIFQSDATESATTTNFASTSNTDEVTSTEMVMTDSRSSPKPSFTTEASTTEKLFLTSVDLQSEAESSTDFIYTSTSIPTLDNVSPTTFLQTTETITRASYTFTTEGSASSSDNAFSQTSKFTETKSFSESLTTEALSASTFLSSSEYTSGETVKPVTADDQNFDADTLLSTTPQTFTSSSFQMISAETFSTSEIAFSGSDSPKPTEAQLGTKVTTESPLTTTSFISETVTNKIFTSTSEPTYMFTTNTFSSSIPKISESTFNTGSFSAFETFTITESGFAEKLSSPTTGFESQTTESLTPMTTLIIDDSVMQNDITVGTENSATVISTTNIDTFFTTNYPSSDVSFTTNTFKPEGLSESTTSMQSEEIKTITTDSDSVASTEINAAIATSEFGYSTFTTDLGKTEDETMNDLIGTTVSGIISTIEPKSTTSVSSEKFSEPTISFTRESATTSTTIDDAIQELGSTDQVFTSTCQSETDSQISSNPPTTSMPLSSFTSSQSSNLPTSTSTFTPTTFAYITDLKLSSMDLESEKTTENINRADYSTAEAKITTASASSSIMSTIESLISTPEISDIPTTSFEPLSQSLVTDANLPSASQESLTTNSNLETTTTSESALMNTVVTDDKSSIAFESTTTTITESHNMIDFTSTGSVIPTQSITINSDMSLPTSSYSPEAFVSTQSPTSGGATSDLSTPSPFQSLFTLEEVKICDDRLWLECDFHTSHCKCKDEMIYDLERGLCVSKVGQNCQSGSDGERLCVKNAECSVKEIGQVGSCKCKDGFLPTESGECLPGLNMPCKHITLNSSESSENCFHGLKCSSTNMSCICEDGFSQGNLESHRCFKNYNSKCSLDISLDDAPCNSFAFLNCSESTKECKCQDPTYQIYNEELKTCIAIAGSTCMIREDIDGRLLKCIQNSSCKNTEDKENMGLKKGTCECNDGFENDWKGNCLVKNHAISVICNGSGILQFFGLFIIFWYFNLH